MPFPTPRIDPRRFEDLVAAALRRTREATPEWTDQSPHDPGVVLIEAFAYLASELIERFNELPDRAYVAFLGLMGVELTPPSAARATLRFELQRPAANALEIVEGTTVAAARSDGASEPVQFITAKTVRVETGDQSVDVLAHHCERVSEEVGRGTGLGGQRVRASRPPIVAPLAEGIDLVVGVEGEGGANAREFERRRYEVWREVENFAGATADDAVYVVDRVSGIVSFAPSLHAVEPDGGLTSRRAPIARVPAEGARIRLWYRRGGGRRGNVPAGALDQLLAPLAGVSVTNPEPATGGRDAESVEHALTRGPLEIHSLRRAITARDYEMWAVQSCGAVNRALAVTRAERWRFAPPGSVELVLVPSIPAVDDPSADVRIEDLEAHERATEPEVAELLASLEERKPLGTQCAVRWARYKRLKVRARAVAHRAEDSAALRARILKRLDEVISPIRRGAEQSGWPFGVPVRASHIYGILLAEPGVLWVEPVRLLVDEVPDRDVTAIERDPTQPRTWYAASGSRIFRSENGGGGWEKLLEVGDASRLGVHANPDRTGQLAVIAELPDGAGEGGSTSEIRVSDDCGETFGRVWRAGWRILDAAWGRAEDGAPVLFLAGDNGLHRLRVEDGATLEPTQVNPQGESRLRAVASGTDRQGRANVAVATESEGVFLSIQGGRRGSFRRLEGLEQTDIRVLEIGRHGIHDYLWAGAMDFSQSGIQGCRRWRLLGAENPASGWEAVDAGWGDAGSCYDLELAGEQVFAATGKGGILRARLGEATPSWTRPPIDCGLPPADEGRFVTQHAVGFDSHDLPECPLLLAGGAGGILSSPDSGEHFESCSDREFSDRVTLPPGWLPCSGDHEIEIVHEHTAQTD